MRREARHRRLADTEPREQRARRLRAPGPHPPAVPPRSRARCEQTPRHRTKHAVTYATRDEPSLGCTRAKLCGHISVFGSDLQL